MFDFGWQLKEGRGGERERERECEREGEREQELGKKKWTGKKVVIITEAKLTVKQKKKRTLFTSVL